jgi:hypothetical protein
METRNRSAMSFVPPPLQQLVLELAPPRKENVQFGSDGEESATKLLKKFSSEVEKFVILATK